ncbi:CBS domain-containing protein, partial [Vineibacter terrae]|uniref:CBS domain-containing protein n=1 Tax=Vineibacter terrae TaxID=2586908 RepID=UPI002E35237E
MKVRDAMTPNVHVLGPDQTIAEAARVMADIDAGAVPVGEKDRLVGMLTDRDIAVRAVAARKSPDTRIREVMSREVRYCFEDEDIEHIVENMGDIQVRRLPVMNRQKRLVGIVSLGDIALTHVPEIAGHGLSGISEPGGQHTQ